MPPIKVMIVDDHTLVREGLMALLKLYDDIVVVGEASDGKAAIDQADQLRPEVILMDIAMPGLGGLEATVEIKKLHPQMKILVLSQYDDKEYLSRFFKVGASGYILKKAMGAELVNAIRAVAKGESYLHSSIASQVIAGYLRGETSEESDRYELLTDREKQVLKLIAEGLTHKEIASTLGISTKTAIAHQSHISEKLDIHSKAELIKFAISEGIIKLET
jgi:DNA-binding NarL/FixJ family response regulator